MNEDQKRSILTVLICFLIFFLWNTFMVPKQPVSSSSPVKVVDSSVSSKNPPNNTLNKSFPNNSQINRDKIDYSKTDQRVIDTFTIKNGSNIFSITNDLVISDFKTIHSTVEFNNIVNTKNVLEFLSLNGVRSPYFTFKKISDNEIEGSFNNIVLNISISKSGFVYFNLSSKNYISFAFNLNTNLSQNSDSGFFNAAQVEADRREFLFYGKSDVSRFDLSSNESFYDTVKWIGLDSNYHFFGLIFENKTPLNVSFNNNVLNANLGSQSYNFKFKLGFMKKEYNQLVEFGDNLDLTVDFGFFSFLAVPILKGLQLTYSNLFPNYGLAIILLTFIIRLITFPLQYKSFKSMKKMQLIQPQLAKLKEKYKDDPQAMQMESMKLFKKSGANPLGGCLPLLLQMPIFFAFYKVLYASVELVNAPFIFWIKDLSVKDPFYVLPILMTLSIFLQQKLTPTTTVDPTQQKVMMFMPLILGLIMKDLPAGLCLYMFVSTLLGIFQQMYVYKTVS